MAERKRSLRKRSVNPQSVSQWTIDLYSCLLVDSISFQSLVASANPVQRKTAIDFSPFREISFLGKQSDSIMYSSMREEDEGRR